jgi:hypothetical protein
MIQKKRGECSLAKNKPLLGSHKQRGITCLIINIEYWQVLSPCPPMDPWCKDIIQDNKIFIQI